MVQENCAEEAPRRSFAHAPTGFRRMTPGLLKADRSAEGFAGLPEGVTSPGQLLAAAKAAAPRLGIAPRLVHAVDWLFRFTQPQDWEKESRPVVWPSASMQEEALGLSPTQVKGINRSLIELGLVTMKDSPNGKRYGKRDPKGRIIADRRTPCRICAPRGGGEGGTRRHAASAPAGDDRAQGHRPDPRDGPGIRLRRRGVADTRPRNRGPGARAEGPSDREAVQNGHSRARAPPDQQGMGDVRNFAIDRVLGEDRVEISIEGVRGITHLRSAPSGARMLGLDQVLDPLSDLNLPLSFATSSKGVPSRASTRARRSASTSGQMPNHASNDGCAW
jgi:hypothetical protein